MPTKPFQLPSGKIVPLTYCVQFPSLSSLYFQAARIGQLENWPFLNSDLYRIEYAATPELHQARRRLQNFDAVVAPPSSRPDAGRLKSWMIADCSITDLSPRFSRAATAEAPGTVGTEKSCGGYSYCSDSDESELSSLVIIDDAIASGRTVDRVLHHLSYHGFDQSKQAVEVVVWAILPAV